MSDPKDYQSPYDYRLPPSTFLSRKSENWYIGAVAESDAVKQAQAKHYDGDDSDAVVTAGVQPPWPGALYMKPINVHTHASAGRLRRSYMKSQNLDGFGAGLGSTDSFGLPLQGLGSVESVQQSLDALIDAQRKAPTAASGAALQPEIDRLKKELEIEKAKRMKGYLLAGLAVTALALGVFYATQKKA